MRINTKVTSRSTKTFMIDFGFEIQQIVVDNQIKRQTNIVIGQEDQI